MGIIHRRQHALEARVAPWTVLHGIAMGLLALATLPVYGTTFGAIPPHKPSDSRNFLA